MPALTILAPHQQGTHKGMPLQIAITYPSLNTMNFKQTFASIAIASLALGSTTFFTPAPAHAATAEELVRFIGVIQRYITDLDKTMNPAPAAIPTNPQPDIPEPDLTEVQ